jgi:rubrerythrin
VGVPGTISLQALSTAIESHAIGFYKTCLLKTNQFSTKYVLQRMIEHHKKHVQQLGSALTFDNENVLNAGLIEAYHQNFDAAGMLSDADIENLNFVEATKLAIGLIKFQIEFYRRLHSQQEDPDLAKNIEAILAVKADYIRDLETESDRLSHRT